eukprot:11473083-Alexandrium_andersonii.AAC.1
MADLQLRVPCRAQAGLNDPGLQALRWVAWRSLELCAQRRTERHEARWGQSHCAVLAEARKQPFELGRPCRAELLQARVRPPACHLPARHSPHRARWIAQAADAGL